MFEVLFEVLAEKAAGKKAASADAKSNLHVVPGAKPVTAEVFDFCCFVVVLNRQ